MSYFVFVITGHIIQIIYDQFLAHDSIYSMQSMLYAIAHPSVHPSVTRVGHSKRLKLESCNFHHSTD